ncbi:MAG: ABC transporter ATP-binding protein [Phycisphaerae bacterium]|nr:ABC transporter ATP-binding protein [Phycisphaerae bacterium]
MSNIRSNFPPSNGAAHTNGHTAATPAVVCRGVTKTYGKGSSAVFALRGVDLRVAPGELLMLVGPSGCGKTTLISIVAGVLDHDDGECIVYGQNLKSMSNAERTEFRGKTVGFVFQSFNLIPTLTVAENIAVPLLIAGSSRAEAIDRSRDILGRVGMGDRWNSRPAQLSGGQQQRVAIARSLIHHPRLIVCDEPTSALDHKTGHDVMQLMREVALASGQSLIVVTHDARIFEFADRIARMDDGRIESIDTPGRAMAASHGAVP